MRRRGADRDGFFDMMDLGADGVLLIELRKIGGGEIAPTERVGPLRRNLGIFLGDMFDHTGNKTDAMVREGRERGRESTRDRRPGGESVKQRERFGRSDIKDDFTNGVESALRGTGTEQLGQERERAGTGGEEERSFIVVIKSVDVGKRQQRVNQSRLVRYTREMEDAPAFEHRSPQRV